MIRIITLFTILAIVLHFAAFVESQDFPSPHTIQRPLPFELVVKNVPYLTSGNDEELLRRTKPIELVIHIPQPATTTNDPTQSFITTDLNTPASHFIPKSMTIEILNADYMDAQFRSHDSWFFSSTADARQIGWSQSTPPEWESQSMILGFQTIISPQSSLFEADLLEYPQFAPNQLSGGDDSGVIYLPEADYDTIEHRMWIGSNLPDLSQIEVSYNNFVRKTPDIAIDFEFTNIDGKVIDVIEMSMPDLGLIQTNIDVCGKYPDSGIRVCPSISIRVSLTDVNGKVISTSATVPVSPADFKPTSSLGNTYKPFNFTFIPFNIMNYNSLHDQIFDELPAGAVAGIIIGTLAGCFLFTILLVLTIVCCVDCCRDTTTYTYTPTIVGTTTATTTQPSQTTTTAVQEEEWPLEAEAGANAGPNKDRVVEMAPLAD